MKTLFIFPLRRMILVLSIMLLANPAWSLEPMDFQYFYDDLGQLTKTVDSQGVILEYVYDEVGNLLQTKRSLASELDIFGFTPEQGSEGISLTLDGKGFSVTPANNSVTINGLAASVVNATETTLEFIVPVGATSGPIEITVGVNIATSDNDFIVKNTPVINSLNPSLLATGMTVSDFQVNGKHLSASSFSFFPEFSPSFVSINSITIAPDGNSANLNISIASNATSTLFLIATNAAGNSGQLPTASNTLRILLSDADTDVDGISNVDELALGSDPLNVDSDNDSWDDGVELEFGGNLLDPAIIPDLFMSASPSHIVTVLPSSIGNSGSILLAKPPVKLDYLPE